MQSHSYPVLHIKAGSHPLQVFRTAESPRLQVNSSTEERSSVLGALHTHFTYEVFFVVSGKITLVTQTEHTDYSQAIVMIPPQIPHVTIRDGESYCLLFAFDEESTIDAWLKSGVCVLPLDEEITFYIRTLTEKSLTCTPEGEQAAEYLSALLFFHIFSAVKPEKQGDQLRKGHTERHINRIDEYINHHLNQKITLHDIAEAVHLSAKQVSRIVFQEYHCSVPELLSSKRLANAVSLLANTDMPVAQIIDTVFCHTPHYFYTVFRKKYGISPLQYRKKRKKLKENEQHG